MPRPPLSTLCHPRLQQHLVVPRHGGVEHDEGCAGPIAFAARWWQERPPPHRGLAHVHAFAAFVVAAEEDEAVAVIADAAPPLSSITRNGRADSVPPPALDDETEVAVDPRPGEEVRPMVVPAVHKEAAHRVPVEVPEQEQEQEELLLIDDGLPSLADTARRRQAASRQTAEDFSERLVG
jgi:hypothetical protein